MKSRIVFDFIRFSGPALNSFASAVYMAMNGNANFPNPTPSLGELNTANQQFAAALDAAQHYDRLRAAEKNKMRVKLEDLLKRLSSYVMLIAGDDRAIQLSAGFHVNAQTRNRVELGPAQSFNVVLGQNSGEAVMSAFFANAISYVYYVAEAGTDNPVWKHYATTENPFLVTGLEPLKTYRFRIKAIGKNKQWMETEEIVKPVL